MKKLLILLGILLLVGTASAVTWTSASGCWTATDGAYNLTKWNATGSSTWTIPVGVTQVEYLLVAGGGGGGANGGSGGGAAGGFITATGFAVTPSEIISVSVGTGGEHRLSTDGMGGNGTNSTFSTLTAVGGGGGAGYLAAISGRTSGGNGGSGGGGGVQPYGTPAGNGTPGQGYNGGAGGCADANGQRGGGGGGSSKVGEDCGTYNSPSTSGMGGNGTASSITGESIIYAGGGGAGGSANGGSAATGGTGGTGGGGNGGQGLLSGGVSGTNGLGGGGGGTGAGTFDSGDGGSGVVIIRYNITTASPTDPILSFTANSTGGTQPLTVQFNDTSVTSPTGWAWDFDDGNTSTLQNPVNTFWNGNYHVNLNVTNASGYNNTLLNYLITVSDSGGYSGFNRQDIMMDQIFTVTFLIKDSSSHNGIPGAIVSLSNGDSTTTDLFGSANFSLNYSAIVASFAATGYQSRSISYVIDRDRIETIYLTAQAVTINTSANTNIVYVPKQIEITAMYYDPAGVVVPGAHVDLTAVANTLQADSQLQTLYGINPEAANQLMNGTLVMHGTTGSDGGIVFTILQSINYQAQVTDPKDSVVYTATLFPGSDPYTIWIGINPIKNVTIPNAVYMNQTRLFVTQPNAGNITDNLIYKDLSGKTTSVTFIVKYASNGTVAYTATSAVSGTNPVYMNYTHPNIRGMGIYYGWNASKIL
jgi:PKD repeat protein